MNRAVRYETTTRKAKTEAARNWGGDSGTPPVLWDDGAKPAVVDVGTVKLDATLACDEEVVGDRVDEESEAVETLEAVVAEAEPVDAADRIEELSDDADVMRAEDVDLLVVVVEVLVGKGAVEVVVGELMVVVVELELTLVKEELVALAEDVVDADDAAEELAALLEDVIDTDEEAEEVDVEELEDEANVDEFGAEDTSGVSQTYFPLGTCSGTTWAMVPLKGANPDNYLCTLRRASGPVCSRPSCSPPRLARGLRVPSRWLLKGRQSPEDLQLD